MDNAKPEDTEEARGDGALPPGVVPSRLIELATMVRFYSRLPVPDLPWERERHAMPDFSRGCWAVPVTGAIIGMIGAMPGGLALGLGLAPMIAAAFTITTLVVITGCFHEDGLADSADGLWGGMTPERRLEIMKDSRVGSYGSAALALSLMLRVALLAELFRLLGFAAVTLVIAVSAASRAFSLSPTQVLAPATAFGLGAKAQKPDRIGYATSAAIGISGLAIAGWQHNLLTDLWLAALFTVLVLSWVIRTVRAKIGGFTGDVLGASQQLVEIALMTGIVIAAGWVR